MRLWGQGGHSLGGSLQLPPMPEKLTIYQVNPLSTWVTRRVGPSARRLGGVIYKVGMDLGDWDLLKGCNRSQSTAGTASDVAHPE